MFLMVESGYIKGSGDRINPTNNISREEFAQIMYNLKKAGLFEKKKEETKAEDKKEENKEETSSGGNSTGGSSKPSGGSSKPSGGSSSGDKDNDQPTISPIPGIDENVDMSDD